MAQQGHEKAVGDLLMPVMAKGNGNADNARFLTSQIAGHLIWAKAIFPRQGLNPLSRSGFDKAAIG
jgi:hypothetical protein